MNYLSLFSGVAGGDLAFQHLLKGFRCVGYVEYEKYPQDVIRQRIEDGLLDCAPIFGDIREFNREYAKEYKGMVDLITGGFPCQDISCAGKGKGIEGERSGLWSEMAKVVCQIRPKYVFVENSPMLTIRGLGVVLKDLAEMGFDAKWGCISASQIKATHKRNRIWIVAYSKNIYGLRSKKKKRNNFQEFRRFESRSKIESNLGRIYDGMAFDVDRLKAIGNGQVSRVAATAWEILKP